MCEELRERFEQFERRDLYDINLVALFLDVAFIAVRPDGRPQEASWSRGDSATRASGCCCR
jgi:hypothetical protein